MLLTRNLPGRYIPMNAYTYACTCMCIHHVQMRTRQQRVKENRRLAMETIFQYQKAIKKDHDEFAAMRVFGLNRSLRNMQVC